MSAPEERLSGACARKQVFPSRKAARRSLRYWLRHGRHDYVGAHPYQCTAGHWHIGHGVGPLRGGNGTADD